MRKNVISFAVAIVVIALLAMIAAVGLNLGSVQIPAALDEEKGIRRGLDLAGGSVITYEAQIGSDYTGNLSNDMTAVESMLRRRLTDLGFTEATLQKSGDRRIRVEIPDVENPEEAVQMLGSTAQVALVDPTGTVVVDASGIKSAAAVYGPLVQNGPNEHHIVLQFDQTATAQFSEATGRLAKATDGNNWIAIMMDGRVLSNPYVNEQINSDSCVISGSFSAEETKQLASLINAGTLPFSLKEVELSSVGPTLGAEALDRSLLAGVIGVLIVMVFMLVYYRLPGLIADIALVCYIAIVAIILSVSRMNLSLPGIAGVILAIGMAVDANIIIFERLKEEIRLGKTINAALKSAFKRAFTAIIDSNITTLIAAAVLWYFGTGPIQGFAQTLFLGVVVSMFTAIIVSRFLLTRLVGMNIKNVKAYGA